MGRISVQAIEACPDLHLVGTCIRGDSLAQKIEALSPEIVVDFTLPDCVYDNTRLAIEMGVHPIVGATGLTSEQITTLQRAAEQKALGGIIAPNFSIGAILMMHFASIATRYFQKAEIIELHHDKKVDRPSGTALKTVAMMTQQHSFGEQGIPIHSVRLPGFFAQQQVLFGQVGEILKIEHAAMDRQAMMPGVILACQKVATLTQLLYGLEHLIDLS